MRLIDLAWSAAAPQCPDFASLLVQSCWLVLDLLVQTCWLVLDLQKKIYQEAGKPTSGRKGAGQGADGRHRGVGGVPECGGAWHPGQGGRERVWRRLPCVPCPGAGSSGPARGRPRGGACPAAQLAWGVRRSNRAAHTHKFGGRLCIEKTLLGSYPCSTDYMHGCNALDLDAQGWQQRWAWRCIRAVRLQRAILLVVLRMATVGGAETQAVEGAALSLSWCVGGGRGRGLTVAAAAAEMRFLGFRSSSFFRRSMASGSLTFLLFR